MREIDHAECLELLPWYVNGTLPSAERSALDRHLRDCGACRAELTACEELSDAVEREAAPAPTPHPAQLAQLHERIERGDPGAEDAAQLRRAGAWRRILRWGRLTPAPVRWLAAAQTAAILLLIWIGLPTRTPGARFRTLSSAAQPLGTERARVVFAPGATEAEIRRLLLEIRAEIVAGPSPLGAYAIALHRAAAGESNASVLERLRADPLVRLAEPVAGDDAAQR